MNGTQPNYGVLLKEENETVTAYHEFHTREETDATKRPQLIVTYSLADLSNEINVSRTLLNSGEQITVNMTLESDQSLTNVSPATNLTVSGTNGVSATRVSGPTPASATVGPAGATFTWVYTTSATTP